MVGSGGRTHGCPAEGTARAKASRLDRPTDREPAVRTGHGANGGRTRGVRSPHPLPARPPQGPPPRSQLAPPARGSRGRPGASNGLRGPGSGEWSPAALMCGRPARRQLVPPRRPRAPIDTHQAAGGREQPPPPGASARSFRGLPRGGAAAGDAGRGSPRRGSSPGSSPPLGARRSLSPISRSLPLSWFRGPRRPLSFPALGLRLSASGSRGRRISRPIREALAFVRSLGPVAWRPPVPPTPPTPLPVSPLPLLSPLGAWESQEAPLGTKPRPGGPGWGK